MESNKARENDSFQNPILAARETYRISEHLLINVVTDAFLSYNQSISQGQYCEGGTEWMLQFLEEVFRLIGLDEAKLLVRQDMNKCFQVWQSYLSAKAN